MRITSALRKSINAGVRLCCGSCPLAEVGLKTSRLTDRWSANGLNWIPDADLGDLVRLADLKTIDDCPDMPNCATLDLYVTSGMGWNRELETNVYVTIKDGLLADLHTEDLKADARCRKILGRPFSDESRP